MEWKHGFKKIAKVRSFKFAWWLLLLNCYIFIPQEIFLSNLVFYAHEPWERVHERVWKNIRNISFCVFSWLSLCIACFPNCISTFFVTFFPLSLCLALSFLDMFLFSFFPSRCTFMVGVYMWFPFHITQEKYQRSPCSLQLLKRLCPLFAIPTLTLAPHSLSKMLCPDVWTGIWCTFLPGSLRFLSAGHMAS